MDLSIQKLSKAFNQKTVFKDLTFEVPNGSKFAITGPNGAGKSTLLKILSGGALPTSGSITYSHQGKYIPEESIYRYVHFIAPYNTVIEELSLKELFQLHQQLGLLKAFENFKSWQEKLEYKFNVDVPVKKYSSGMKQRVKLGLALLDDRPLLLLDEPGSNLDAAGKLWLQNLIQHLSLQQTLVIATNDPAEMDYCNNQIIVGD